MQRAAQQGAEAAAELGSSTMAVTIPASPDCIARQPAMSGSQTSPTSLATKILPNKYESTREWARLVQGHGGDAGVVEAQPPGIRLPHVRRVVPRPRVLAVVRHRGHLRRHEDAFPPCDRCPRQGIAVMCFACLPAVRSGASPQGTSHTGQSRLKAVSARPPHCLTAPVPSVSWRRYHANRPHNSIRCISSHPVWRQRPLTVLPPAPLTSW